jgi:TonB-dependent receptor
MIFVMPAFAQETADTEQPEETRQLETVVIRGEFIPAPQRQTSQVASFLAPEDLARQGDANAALALTRLSGLSIVSDKFAYVRGLGDRYSAAMLNGSPLPSPEPMRRTVPLDLFPSNILDGAAVQKTYSVAYPGEFGGGVIDLKTLRQPRESFLNVKVGTSWNTATTGQEGIYVNGGDLDWLGYDDGLRDIPAPLGAVLGAGNRLNSYSDAEVEAIGESLVNSPLSVIQNGDLGPNVEGSVDGGMSIDAGGYEIGLVGVVAYDQEWQTQEATRQFVQGNVLGTDLKTLETSHTATVNALGSATVEWTDGEVQGTVFYVHSTSKEAQIDQGRDFNAQGSTGQIFDESTGWFERSLLFGQLRGEQYFGDLTFSWRGSLAQSTRDAPYERSLRRFVDADLNVLYSVANSYNVRFSELTDDNASFGADLKYETTINGTREAILSAGFDTSKTDRLYEFLAFRFAGGNSLPMDVQLARPDYLFSPDNIDPARFVLQEISTPNDSYEAGLDVVAGYVQADLELFPFVRATLGARYEQAEQDVRTFDRFGNPGAGDVNLDNDYILPSATFTWNFADDLQLRLGYSQTIARPQFRELALSNYFDPDTERSYRGNNGLVDSQLKNYDARLEYYMGRNEFITLAAFHKEIKNPIEEVQFSTSTFVFETTFINSPKAVLTGAEFEYRTRFDMPISNPWFDAREWLFSTNYTYTSSEVQAGVGDKVFDPISKTLRDAALFGLDGSSLQGTPENIVNMQFGWESDVEQMTLLLGWVDERILQRGLDQPGAELPDIIENPGIQLDLVYRRDFNIVGRDFTLGLSGRNLLDEAHEEYQENDAGLGRTEFNTYDRGQSFSASLTMRF